MSQSAKLFIRLPQADYNALSDGKYFLNFTRDITTTTGELREVWDLKSLDGSKPVKGGFRAKKESSGRQADHTQL